jgi:hypothetical protein
MKKIFVFVLAFLVVYPFSNSTFAQLKLTTETGLHRTKNKSKFNTLSVSKETLLRNEFLKLDTLETGKKLAAGKKKKSPGLAFLYSLAIPGMGQVYTDRFDVGKYYMISEAALWLGFASFTIYGNWLLDDAYDYAVLHAGIIREDKDDDFFINIANYDNVEQYNNDMLQRGEYDKIYFPEQGWGFYWDRVENRKSYREDKLGGDRVINDRLFIVGAILVNHVVSAISAIILTNKHNSELENSSGGFSLGAGVVKYGDRVNGLKLKFTKWF